MTGVTLGIDIDDRAAQEAFARLIARGAHLRPVMQDIGPALVQSTQERFDGGIGPDGAAWPPSQRAQKTGGQTLVLSGDLARSITFIAAEDSVEVGTNMVYGAIHQFGGEITNHPRSQAIHRQYDRKTDTVRNRFARASSRTFTTWHEVGEHTVFIPARPYLGIDGLDQREILDIITDHLAEAVA